MIPPPYLRPGDIVGLVAPARSISPVEVSTFTALVESWGYKVKKGTHLFDRQDQFAGSDEDRASDIQEMLESPEVRAIVCVRGGYGSVRTLQHIDFSPLEKDPKWFAGFSDITVFHSYLNKFTGIESLHAPMPMTFDDESDPLNAEYLKKALSGEMLKYRWESHPLCVEGEVEGELVGGNLSVLYSLNGTVLFPDLRNKILFIEEVDEYLYHIDRMMMNFSLSGVFNRIKALVVGGFTKVQDNPEPYGKRYYEIIHEITDHYDIPVCFDFPAGHQKKNRTLIFGRKMRLRVEEQECYLG